MEFLWKEFNLVTIFRTNSDLYVKVAIYYGTIKLDEVKSKPLKYEKILKKVDYIIFSDV